MAAPFSHYQWMTTIASKVGGPIPLVIGIFGLGAVVAEATRPHWKPALDGALGQLRNQRVFVKDENGETVSMTSEEIVDQSLPKQKDAASLEGTDSEESAD
ncbi:hypothetical protein BTIS_1662 [Bifidobacterium tissieri]|uniref:Uncharacterized protein n=1 Tax=Bifidobacterium tissieri TaxID=1630162 RepID=A0A261FCX1_9BIFI|nr:hypothetical protein [Bifidobacterium tissieri]OZG57000.1 hypothetical protein BTIS_1662 [Bifidobacterium tissieri]